MTTFDFVVLALLAISGIVGFARGAVREIFALVALAAAAALAILALPMVGPAAHKVIHSGWIGTACALAGIFLVTYIALRVIGGVLARRAQDDHMLGALDRSLGLAIGLARGLAVLGGLNLMFNAATPADLRPRWITGATTWPLAQDMGRALTAMAPRGLDLAGHLKPAFERAVHDGSRDRTATDRYDARRASETDDLVEKSR